MNTLKQKRKFGWAATRRPMVRLVLPVVDYVWKVDPKNPWKYIKKAMIWVFFLQLILALLAMIAVILLIQEKQKSGSRSMPDAHSELLSVFETTIRDVAAQNYQIQISFDLLQSSQAELSPLDNQHTQEFSEPRLHVVDLQKNLGDYEASGLARNPYYFLQNVKAR